jgi:hypothetical protein
LANQPWLLGLKRHGFVWHVWQIGWDLFAQLQGHDGWHEILWRAPGWFNHSRRIWRMNSTSANLPRRTPTHGALKWCGTTIFKGYFCFIKNNCASFELWSILIYTFAENLHVYAKISRWEEWCPTKKMKPSLSVDSNPESPFLGRKWPGQWPMIHGW